ncbi:hypothetical protein [Pseudomonas sp. CGJS7]|uniref:hypothetical protein n=1 Tax=Pseudomonas sp. CGJS7 TaxID=3109348 RepID=UPI00300AF1B1
MSVEIVSRPMTDEEKRTLAASARFQWIVSIAAARAGLIVAAMLLALIVVLWFGRHWLPSCANGCVYWAHLLQLVALMAAIFAVSAVLLALSRRWLERKRLRALRADLRAGMVDEERYRFSGCECFVHAEGEHVMYLLRIDASRCLAVYDYGQISGDPDDEHMLTLLRPRTEAVQRRAPCSRTVLSIALEGADLAFVPQLDVPSRGWPPDRAVWEVPWDQVRQRLMAAGGPTLAALLQAERLRDHRRRAESQGTL